MEKKKVAIYGASGFGRELYGLIELCGQYEVICFIDDDASKSDSNIYDIPVMDLDAACKRYHNFSLVGGVGNPKVREILMNKISAAGVGFVQVVHPSVEMFKNIDIGKGVVICGGCILTTDIVLGEHVQINLSCTIGHDVIMGDYTTLAPGVHVSGWVHFGKRVYVGTGAVIINGTQEKPLIINDDAVIGAAACVTKSVPVGQTWVGVPARAIKPSK